MGRNNRRAKSKLLLILSPIVIILSNSHPALASYNATTHTYEWTDDLHSTDATGAVNYDPSPKVQTKAAHMLELKDAIDQVAPLCGASNIWTAYDLQVLSQVRIGSKVSKEQLNTLRKGIRSLYSAKSQTAPSSVADLNTNTPTRIQKSHIQDMRDAMTALIPICLASSGAVCGNGVKEGTEQCDDHNLINGDGCSSTCQNESNCYWTETSQDLACLTAFNPTCPTGLINEQLVGGGPVSCAVAGAQCQDGLATPEVGACGGVFGIIAFMRVNYQCQCGGGPSSPVCGNGIIEAGEQCDDHNTTNGDGCSSTCQTETCLADGAMCIGVYEACGTAAQSICDSSCCSGAGMLSFELGYCSGVCVSNAGPLPTCSDGVQNQGETGVDCGGPCAACPPPSNACFIWMDAVDQNEHCACYSGKDCGASMNCSGMIGVSPWCP